MRIKTFFLSLACGVAVFFCLILIGSNQRPSIQSIVSETNKHITNLKNLRENLRDAEQKRFQAEEKHLELLGFTKNARLYPADCWTNTTLPVIVTIIFKGEEEMGIGFAKNTGHMAGNHAVLIYTVGLSQTALQSVSANCNTSRCQVIPFDMAQFPQHVQDEPTRTAHTLVIQDALHKAGAVFYIDNTLRITNYIDVLMDKKPVGSFLTRQAVTTLTHPGMMDYFKTSKDSFLFLPMVEMTRLLLWNTELIHDKVMLPWTQCVLTPDCIHPIGAQSEGCRFNKKPQYRYSGCHAYEASALNIALGLLYQFDKANYTFSVPDTYFTAASDQLVTDNATALV